MTGSLFACFAVLQLTAVGSPGAPSSLNARLLDHPTPRACACSLSRAADHAARFRLPDFPLFERNTHAVALAPSDAASSIAFATIQANVKMVGNRWVAGKTSSRRPSS